MLRVVAGLDPTSFGNWYKEVGASLNTASTLNAYTMSDRASWLNFAIQADLKLLFFGDPVRFSQYAYIPVNPDRHGHVSASAANRVEDWLSSPTARELVDGYTIGGVKLFTFNASDP